MSEQLSYAKAGVDIDVTDAAKREMTKSIDVDNDRVLNKLGAFASLLEGRFDGMKHPILVFKTDEPGSKQKLAFELGRVTGLAHDLANHRSTMSSSWGPHRSTCRIVSCAAVSTGQS